jgi:TetR/AcrR family transcriptional repressor of nem operon
MRRSRSEAAATRTRIVSTASKLFLNKGLAAVGMRDIMGAADLTQGGFYRHFESKDQLIAEATGEAAGRALAALRKQIVGESKAKALETIVTIYLGQSQNRKKTSLCPIAMIGAELSHCDERARNVATLGYKGLVQLVSEYLPHQSEPERIRRASGIVSTMAGAVMLANIAPDRGIARSILTNAKTTIRILSRVE